MGSSIIRDIKPQMGSQTQRETNTIENIEHIDSSTGELQRVATESEILEEQISKTRSPTVIKSPRSAQTSSTEEKTSVEVNHR